MDSSGGWSQGTVSHAFCMGLNSRVLFLGTVPRTEGHGHCQGGVIGQHTMYSSMGQRQGHKALGSTKETSHWTESQGPELGNSTIW